MSAQRRITDREAAASVKRMWQMYADQIGIPNVGPGASNERLPHQSADLMPGRRTVRAMGVSAGRLLAALGIVVVAVITGSALWLEFSSAPGKRADDGLHASAPAVPRPSEIGGSLRATPDTVVARRMGPVRPSTVSKPDPTQTSQPLSAETKQERPKVMSRINFDSGSDRINDESKPSLDTVIIAMKANPDWRVVIKGHTDPYGAADYNLALSERRAQAVKAYLQSAGIAPERLSVIGFGASRPVAPNDVLGNALNRRVEVHRQ
jgi:outer membrane protein OmpA-like peptidoglycan-associated protein